MAKSRGSARRYAEAAFQIAQRDGTVDVWRSDLATAAEILGREDALRVLANPAVPYEARAELAERLPQDPGEVLRKVAGARLLHHVKTGWPILDPTVRFWNSLAAAGSGSR